MLRPQWVSIWREWARICWASRTEPPPRRGRCCCYRRNAGESWVERAGFPESEGDILVGDGGVIVVLSIQLERTRHLCNVGQADGLSRLRSALRENGKEERREDRDDGDSDEQFGERKRSRG